MRKTIKLLKVIFLLSLSATIAMEPEQIDSNPAKASESNHQHLSSVHSSELTNESASSGATAKSSSSKNANESFLFSGREDYSLIGSLAEMQVYLGDLEFINSIKS